MTAEFEHKSSLCSLLGHPVKPHFVKQAKKTVVLQKPKNRYFTKFLNLIISGLQNQNLPKIGFCNTTVSTPSASILIKLLTG